MAAEKTFLTTFFTQLNAAGIVYAVARNWDSLPESLDGSDLDVLVKDEPNLQLLLKIAKASAEKCGGAIVTYYRVEGVAICLGGRLASGDWWGCHIDAFIGYRFHGFDYMDALDVLKDRVLEKGLFYRANKYTEITAFFKELLANGHDKKGYYAGARDEYARDPDGVMSSLISAFDEKTRENLASLLSREYDAQELRRTSHALYGALMRHYVAEQGIVRFARVKIHNYLRRFVRVFNPPGFTVAFLGTDGAGKSTLIEAVKPVIENMLHSAVHYEHLRPNLLPSLSRLAGRPQKEGPTTDPHGGKVAGRVSSLVRFFYYYIDYVFGYWIKIYPILIKRASMVIFDRYYYEYIIDPRRCAVQLPKGFARFFSAFIPKPKLILCLIGDPAKIYARKPETNLEEVTRQVRELKAFCENVGRAVLVDTTLSLNESIDQALGAVIHAMARRYE